MMWKTVEDFDRCLEIAVERVMRSFDT